MLYLNAPRLKEFKVHWVDSKPPTHLSVEIRMDGRRMGVISHQKQSSRTSSGGFRVSIDAHCPYQFAPVPTTGESSLKTPWFMKSSSPGHCHSG